MIKQPKRPKVTYSKEIPHNPILYIVGYIAFMMAVGAIVGLLDYII